MIVVREVELKYKSKESLDRESAYIDAPQKAYNFLSEKIGDQLKEHFTVIMLNNKNKALGWEVVSVGTVSEAIIHPREVFRSAIYAGASAVIVAHNHPTGETTPSREDIATTNRLKEAGQIVGIPVLDHIIVAEQGFLSMKEGGYL